MKKNKFMLIDSKLNTVLIDVDDESLNNEFKFQHLTSKIKRHRTKKEFNDEISAYLKSGGVVEDADS